MNARRSGFRARATFPVTLIVIALGLGVAGFLRLLWSTPTPPELENSGFITVYTSDPDASVDFEIQDKSDPTGANPKGYWVHVSAHVESAKAPLWWAVALGRDARFPPGEAPESGTMPTAGANPDRPGGFGSMDTSGPDQPAYFVNGVEWPDRGEGTEEGDGSVIFGNEPNKVITGSKGDFWIYLTVKVRGPLLKDVGEYVTLSTPTLGRPGYNSYLGGRGNPWQFYNGEADPKLLAMVYPRRWYEPKDLQVGFDGQFTSQLKGARQEEAGTAPVAPFGKQWRAKDTLKVEASFRRPAEAAKNERWVFFAGVLVSLAASFLVWALELLLGPERHPVARSGDSPRSRTPADDSADP